jgi:hypothetical protein
MSRVSDDSVSDPIPFEVRGHSFALACEALGICPNSGLKLVRDGKLKSYRVGRRHLVTGAAILECQAALSRSAS